MCPWSFSNVQKIREQDILPPTTSGQHQLWPWQILAAVKLRSDLSIQGTGDGLKTEDCIFWGSPLQICEWIWSCTGRAGAKSCPRPVLVTRAWQLFSHSDQELKALQGRTDLHKEVTSYGSCSLKAPPTKLPCRTSSEVGGQAITWMRAVYKHESH